MTTTHVSDREFPFTAHLTHPVGEYPVGSEVEVVGYDDDGPHTYKVKGGAGEVSGVSPLWLDVPPPIEDPHVVDPTRDPVAEAREAAKGDAEALDAQVRAEAEDAAKDARRAQVAADREQAKQDAARARAVKDDKADEKESK